MKIIAEIPDNEAAAFVEHFKRRILAFVAGIDSPTPADEAARKIAIAIDNALKEQP